jgi:hypothetical protein
MTLTANEPYFAILHYLRVKEDRLGEGLSLQTMAPILHEQYRKTRSMGHVLDSRLQAYFQAPEPHKLWHAAIDLLAVQYYTALEQASHELLESNAGESHSRLSVGELQDRAVVVRAFRETLREATTSVLVAPLLSVNQMQ